MEVMAVVKEEKPNIKFDYLPVPSTITQLDLINQRKINLQASSL